MLPVTNQLPTTSGGDPNIGVAEHVVGDEISREADGEGHYFGGHSAVGQHGRPRPGSREFFNER